MICRKATFTVRVFAVMLPDANFLSSRAQNQGFCALLAFGTPVFRLFKHKIGVFVLFWPSGPPFSGFSSTKSGFLCQNGQFFSGFCPSRAQNRGFCARGWSSGKRLRDYGSRFFVISVPNGVQSVHNCIVFFKKSPEEKIIQHPYGCVY